MPSEHTSAAAQAGRPRSGPRHAAPRKPLLYRVPAGKAIALAAMPTAVFLGMGLSPKLAQADDSPADRWLPGPCAEQSDEPKDEASKKPKPSESASPSAEPSPSPSAGTEAEGDAAAKPAPEDSQSSQRSGDSGSDGSGDPGTGGSQDADGSDAESASPSPSPSESNPWYDPLGIGNKLEDALTPDEPSPSPSESSAGSGDSGSGSTGSDAGSADTGSGTGGSGGSGGTAAEERRSETEQAIRDAAEEAGASVEELDEKVRETAENPADETGGDATGADGKAGENGKNGKQPFPCPTKDADALAAAELEPGIPLLPDDPWRLETSKLTLTGLKYHGIVEVKTYNGEVKKVLKYTAEGVDIKDLHQIVVGPGRHHSHVRAAEGSTSTIRDGTVTMYTEELSGKLFGLIPITFSPESPPPLDLPFVMFTDAQVIQAGQFGGTLTVPGLHNTIED